LARVGHHDVGQAVAVQVADRQRPAALIPRGERIEDQPSALAGVVLLHLIEREHPGPARLRFDGQELVAPLAVDLGKGDGLGRLDEEPLLRPELAPGRRESESGRGPRCRRRG